ncbi:hypothetical protein CPC16_003169, partial [Podila verticillata]
MIFAKTIVVLCTAAAVMAASCRSQNKFSNWGMGRSRTSVMMKTVRCECGDTNTHEDDEWTAVSILTPLYESRNFYERNLSNDLFDEWIQYYAIEALQKSGFASAFDHELKRYDERERTWATFKRCINKELKFETLRGNKNDFHA